MNCSIVFNIQILCNSMDIQSNKTMLWSNIVISAISILVYQHQKIFRKSISISRLFKPLFYFVLQRKNLRLYMITQLSNALRYLEGQQIIHRDISARNCLIYPNYEIKLTNSAIASEQFQSHYYCVSEIRLPIRWMAPESIINVSLFWIKIIDVALILILYRMNSHRNPMFGRSVLHSGK